jgi:predicted CoA-binding protein
MTTIENRKIAIIGASANEERYANMAQQLLMEKGYPVIPVSAQNDTILGVKTVKSLNDVNAPIDTVTLYVGPQRQEQVINDILACKPKRVIFNPGTENPDAYATLEQAGIDFEEACTLVLLRTRQF